MALRDIDFTRSAMFAGEESHHLLRNVEAQYRLRVGGKELRTWFESTWDQLTRLLPEADIEELSTVDKTSADTYYGLFGEVHPLVLEYDPYAAYFWGLSGTCDRCGCKLNAWNNSKGCNTLCDSCDYEECSGIAPRPVSEL